MNPVVAIVGRPNVGKSTLFNRLVGKGLAIVHDLPGVTRDRHYAEAHLSGRNVTLVDTGGFDPSSGDPMQAGIARHVEAAIDEADVVVCVLDGSQPPTEPDRSAVELLRRARKPVVYVANKVDAREHEMSLGPLYELGIHAPHPQLWRRFSPAPSHGMCGRRPARLQTLSLGAQSREGIRMTAARIDRVAALAGGEVGERFVVEDLEHRVADVEHDVAQRAGRLVRAGARLVVAQADAAHRRERSVKQPDDPPDRHLCGIHPDGVAAVRPERRSHDPAVAERGHDLLEELGRQAVPLGERGERDRAVILVTDQVGQGAKAVLGAA